MDKLFNSINWSSDVFNSSGVYQPNETITHVMVYSDTQCSGLIPLDYNNVWFEENTRGLFKTWFFDKFRDIVITNTQSKG